MANVIRVQQGGIVPLRVVTREVRTDDLNGRRVHPSGMTITIYDPSDEPLPGIVEISLSFIQSGDFIYYWDTTELTLGDYKASLRYGYAFSSSSAGVTKVSERDIILRLVAAA